VIPDDGIRVEIEVQIHIRIGVRTQIPVRLLILRTSALILLIRKANENEKPGNSKRKIDLMIYQ
jgi:hypothetical protein